MGKRGQRAGDYNFFYGRRNDNHKLIRDKIFCTLQNSISS